MGETKIARLAKVGFANRKTHTKLGSIKIEPQTQNFTQKIHYKIFILKISRAV